MSRFVKTLTLLLLSTSLCQTVSAKSVNFDLLGATPEGSWQIREDIQTYSKGRQNGTTIKSSMLGSEMRNGEKHYWLEMAIDSFKINKKGKRKNVGDRTLMKSLIAEQAFKGDPANVMGNLRGFGVEVIVQSGKEDPMRISGTGGMMAGVMAAMQTEIKYDFEQLPAEQVTVKGGDFHADKIQGHGVVDMKVLFKKIHVESDTTMWLSKKVPFGIVKIAGTSTINGKQSSNTAELLEFGNSGALSEITKEPVDMPAMPNIFGN